MIDLERLNDDGESHGSTSETPRLQRDERGPAADGTSSVGYSERSDEQQNRVSCWCPLGET
jgi:hypothetical protein